MDRRLPERLAEELRTAYGVAAPSLHPLGSSGRAWRIRSQGRALVLRLFPERRPAALLDADIRALQFLDCAAYPAPRLVRRSDCGLMLSIDGQRGYVTDFIEGSPVEIDSVAAHRIGVLAGQLHALDVSGAALTDTSFSVRRVRQTFQEHAANPAIQALDGWQEVATPAAEAWRKLSTLEDLPRVLLHTDIHAANVIRSSDGTLALVDWDDAGLGPAVIDVGIFLVHSCLTHDDVVRGICRWRTDLARAFIAGYHVHRAVTPDEWAALPDALTFAALAYLVQDWVPVIAMSDWRRFLHIERELPEIMASLRAST